MSTNNDGSGSNSGSAPGLGNASGAQAPADGTMSITVKQGSDKVEYVVPVAATVQVLKEKIASQTTHDISRIRLIYAGKILNNEDTLESHKIGNGALVHLVLKSRPVQAQPEAGSNTQRPANTSQTPFGLNAFGGIPGLSNLGMGSANFMDMQQRVSNELMGNPDMMRQLLDMPLTQNLMSNPEILRTLIQSNPQMQQLIDRNPEINHMLNNPEVLRQTMDIARNPAMLQELMRNQDRAISNLEAIPGGRDALHRLYRDVQEPMMNAAQEQFASNPFTALGANNASGSTQAAASGSQTGENSAPVPNPWTASTTATAGAATTTTSGSTATTNTGNTTSGRGQTGGDLFASPGMQSLMQQMTENPQIMQNMLSAPYTQAMLNAMRDNPPLANDIIGMNPLFSGNPQLQQQMRNMMPMFMEQLRNPAVVDMMGNPDAISALQQIQQGMQRLRASAPGIYDSMGMPNIGPFPATASSTTTTSSTSAPTTSSTSTTDTTTSSSTSNTTPTSAPPSQGDSFAQLMNQMVSSMAEQGLNNPPEERYRNQLNVLEGMGFSDHHANVRALIATFGDLNAAIDRLLGNQQQPS